MATPHDEAELGQTESVQRTGPSLVQVAWQRKSLVILGLMLGLMLGLLYYAQRPPVYSSSAAILVVKKGPDAINLGQGQGGQYSMVMDDYMATQSVLLKSPLVIGKAVEKMKTLVSFRSENDGETINAVREALTVARDSRETASGVPTNVLTATIRGPIADECPSVLNALVESYTNFLNDTYQNVSEKAAQFILNAHDMLRNDLEKHQQEYYDFCLKKPLLILKREGGSNLYTERLARIERRRSDLNVELTELQTNYGIIEETHKKSGKGVALQMLQSLGVKIALLEGTQLLDKELINLQVMQKKLSEFMGANHPDMRVLTNQIEMIRKFYGRGTGIGLNQEGTQLPPAANGKDSPVEMDTIEVILAAMKAEIEGKKQLLQAHEREFIREQKDALELTTFELEQQKLKERVDSRRKLFDQLATRVQELKLSKDAASGGYEAKLIFPPGLGRKIAPNPMQVFPLSAILGLAAGVGLAYLAEMSDKSFRTPAEIRRRLGLPVIGHIPFFDADDATSKQVATTGTPAQVDPMVISHYQSNSIAAEAYRGVRTALYFNSQGVGHQVIQVTSPNVSDGKSTLAANLAVSIAQSGKRTILIDGDCRKPKVHKFFNVPGEAGLASVIAGTTELDASVQQSAVPNLSILPCGPRPANPAELLTSPRFKELLDMIRSRYEFVIVDTPPLLVVTDPCVVAPRVDGVVLTIRVTKNGRPYAERAKEILASLGANVIGVVVNGFGGQAGGRYGYEHYQYGYGYGYGYSYSYSYGYKEDEQAKSYYRQSPESDKAAKN